MIDGDAIYTVPYSILLPLVVIGGTFYYSGAWRKLEMLSE